MYKLKNFKEDLPATLYAIYFFEVEFSEKDIMSVKNTLRRYKKKYPYIGYLLAISNTDSKYCVQREIRLKNRKGRPPTIVLGNKIPIHIHLSIIGDYNHSAYSVAKQIVNTLNKRFEGKCAIRRKGRKTHAKVFINYSLKQSKDTWIKGLFEDIIEKKKNKTSKQI